MQLAADRPRAVLPSEDPARPETAGPDAMERLGGPSEPWRLVTDAGLVDLPAVERNRLDEEWLKRMPGPIPPEVLQALKRRGHEVQQRRDLVPLRLKDGRQLVVPIDQVDVQYVGRPAL
jgi:hypothetical protein